MSIRGLSTTLRLIPNFFLSSKIFSGCIVTLIGFLSKLFKTELMRFNDIMPMTLYSVDEVTFFFYNLKVSNLEMLEDMENMSMGRKYW